MNPRKARKQDEFEEYLIRKLEKRDGELNGTDSVATPKTWHYIYGEVMALKRALIAYRRTKRKGER